MVSILYKMGEKLWQFFIFMKLDPFKILLYDEFIMTQTLNLSNRTCKLLIYKENLFVSTEVLAQMFPFYLNPNQHISTNIHTYKYIKDSGAGASCRYRRVAGAGNAQVGGDLHQERRQGVGEKREGFNNERLQMERGYVRGKKKTVQKTVEEKNTAEGLV